MKRALAILAAAALSLPAAALADESETPPGPADPETPKPQAQPAKAAAQPVAGPIVVVVTPGPPPADAPPPERTRPEVSLGLGLRGSLLSTKGFDPFSKTDFLAQPSLLAQLTVVRTGPAAILLFAGWDIGSRSATARGQETSLTMHRLLGGAETRLYLHRRFYFDAKLAGVAHHLRGSIEDPILGRPLVSRTWTWGLDVSGGAGVVLAGARSNTKLYLTLDLGYAFAGEAAMSYAPAFDEEDPRKYGLVKLPVLKPAGPTGRLGLALGF